MKIRVKLFASVKDIVGRREVVLDLPEGITAAGLLERFAADHPGLRGLAPSLLLAVNREYVEGSRVLAEGDEVAFIPPVSGGVDLYEVTESPLSLDRLVAAVSQNTSGAVASFLGIVREFARGRQVRHLEYDAYPEMATATMRQIGDEIRGRWPVDRIAMVHRIGRLTIGEASVGIAIAAPHRQEALQACAYAIERVKEIVPIWKKEVWTDGAEWIGSTVDEYQELQAKSQAPRAASREPRAESGT
ncbi:MAG: molybdopterin converting factor subunit 1 [candidate division NC10 bacterium]|nr:molybdopterin converting factor subunit 1 [candidate division NC10 bacterium]MBI2116254.1 molybdopterin converting factor subunit 1 [candidate division NC10 bacterium]